MKAVVMAGGEGTRLRPMTSNMPKPLLPVADRPIMEHVLRLLKRHGLTETVVTVQFLATLVRNRFGDGDELGMQLKYANEHKPLGTAGSVKNAEEALRDDTFIVISGDALTDIDLSDLIRFHKKKEALVTVCLTRVSDPLEFGITITDDHGRVERFLEKPTWGQVFSDTVNTGIYLMEPEVFDYIQPDAPVDWSADVFPRLLAAGEPVYGYVADGYWEDVGAHDSYVRVQADVLEGRVEVDLDGFEISPGVWVGEGAEVHPNAVLNGPLYIGNYAKVEAGVEVGEHTVIGSNVVAREGATLHRATVHDNVYIGPQSSLRGCVIGKNTDLMRGVRLEDGAVVGDECLLGDEAYVGPGVRIYPAKTIDPQTQLHTSVIWEARGQAHLFDGRGVSGILNVDITPELVVRLAGAYATTLKKGSTVTTARDHSRGARALKRAIVSSLQASAIDVRDLENVPLPVVRQQVARGSAGGIMVRTTPGAPEAIDILFLDERGGDLSPTAQRKIDRVYARQEYRRAFPGEVGDLTFPASVFDSYVNAVLQQTDTAPITIARPKVVLDAAFGNAGLVLPSLLGRLGVDALTINSGMEERRPTETESERQAGLARLGEIVSSARAAFGVRFDPVGEQISLVDEYGRPLSDERTLLILLDLASRDRSGIHVALPSTTTRVAERIIDSRNARVHWTGTSPTAVMQRAGEVDFAGDGQGRFATPSAAGSFDALSTFVYLTAQLVHSGESLSELDFQLPRTHVLQRDVPTPWQSKGAVMRTVVEAAGNRATDTSSDGVRVIEANGSWAMILPDAADAVTHLWAEGPEHGAAQKLLDVWEKTVQTAVR